MEVAGTRYLVDDDMDMLVNSENDILEEIEEDEENLLRGKSNDQNVSKTSPEKPQMSPRKTEIQSPPTNLSPSKVGREFGNISPISELLDDNDDSQNIDEDFDDLGDRESNKQDSDSEDNVGKVTPEPRPNYPNRASFPRISDGRSSPILAYSPSLIKSPSTKNNSKSSTNSPSLGSGNGSVGKRPRNIARMLDNISDHSSGDEEVNNVGILMAKCTV